MDAIAPAIPPVKDLDELACIVRDEIQKARHSWSNALGHGMNAGDALITLQSKVPIKWKGWLQENCSIAVSTAELYMQLARNRALVEVELQRDPELSLRSARRLISKARAGGAKNEDLAASAARGKAESEVANELAEQTFNSSVLGEIPETLIAHWQRSPGELGVLLDAVGVDGLRAAMSPEFNAQLCAKLPANPLLKLREMDAATAADTILQAFGKSRATAILAKLQALIAPKGNAGRAFGKTLNLNLASARPPSRH